MFDYDFAFTDFMADFPIELFIALTLWSAIWKGMALWLSARRGQTGWFVVFLVINTLGIAEIIYLLVTKGFAELKGGKDKS